MIGKQRSLFFDVHQETNSAATPCCSFVAAAIEPREAFNIVQNHNKIRASVLPSAANMEKMVNKGFIYIYTFKIRA